MNADHHIAAAESALLTNQPNLALLHMRRAAELLEAERATTRAAHLKAVQRILLTRAARKIGNHFSGILEGMTAAIESFVKAFTGAAQDMQDAYALAGPSKAGSA